MTFFIGAVVALIGSDLLKTLGASELVVELVGISVLREFGVLIPAILLAGRSASTFAAQIGAMRMNQETQAMKVMGIDLFDAPVVPRVLALLVIKTGRASCWVRGCQLVLDSVCPVLFKKKRNIT